MLFSLISVTYAFSPLSTQLDPVVDKADGPDFIAANAGDAWVDSILDALTLEQKIGQLFMVAAYSNKDEKHKNEIAALIKDYQIGGLIFMQGGPVRQAELCNYYQSVSKVPLMIAMDAEWGLSMRLDSTVKYPRQMMMGALSDPQLVYQLGKDMAAQCKRIGVHVSFSPVVDINSNPKNPVINSRSFGEDKRNVSDKSLAYMKGLQDGRIMACAKHFPGHGDTDSDSHYSLPLVNHTRQDIDNIDLFPFKHLINNGLASVMVAHLSIPSLDTTANRASTLSPYIVDTMLQQQLKFKGLIFTDALNMKGVAKYNAPGDVDFLALKAGNDVLLFSEDVPKAKQRILNALASGELNEKYVTDKVRKILKSKYWLGLHKIAPINIENLYADLNKIEYQSTINRITENAITLAVNTDNIVPIKNLENKKILSIVLNEKSKNTFQITLQRYANVECVQIENPANNAEFEKLLTKLNDYDIILVSVHNLSVYPKNNYKFDAGLAEALNKIAGHPNAILGFFGNPYALATVSNKKLFHATILSYEESEAAQTSMAQIIFGALPAKGKLPITIDADLKLGMGEETSDLGRLKYGLPEDVGIARNDLKRIDSIILDAIQQQTFPGCQVLVAKDNTVIFNKYYGYQTYEKLLPVNENTLYDIASVTKIIASTASLMHLEGEGKLQLEYSLCDYIPELVNGTPYEHLTLQEILAHQAGLEPFINFYKEAISNGVLRYDVFSMAQSDLYPNQVADKIYVNKDYKDKMYKKIVSTPLRPVKEYKYSDIGYYFMQMIIEKLSGTTLDKYADSVFYAPIGAHQLTYRPTQKYPIAAIAPTEYDTYFRKQQVHGFVHDPGAAMLGGVGGHAGLFSNANDLAKMMQMYLNNGTYGGKQFLDSTILKKYENCQFCETNRRAAGFDKPVMDGVGPTCQCVSFDSFGHQGFTGTMVWADPEKKVVYIFLSNRVYPNADNKKISTLSVRSKVQEVIYDAISKSELYVAQ